MDVDEFTHGSLMNENQYQAMDILNTISWSDDTIVDTIPSQETVIGNIRYLIF